MTLPNADDPRGGTPMNTDDELTKVLEYIDAECIGVSYGSHGFNYDKAEVAVNALIRKSTLQRAIEELQRHDFQSSDDYTDRQYVKDRIAVLQAELQQVEKGGSMSKVIDDWYLFSSKLPLYHCIHLLMQIPDDDLDNVIRQLKLLKEKQA